jgi:hypothetical protein
LQGREAAKQRFLIAQPDVKLEERIVSTSPRRFSSSEILIIRQTKDVVSQMTRSSDEVVVFQ